MAAPDPAPLPAHAPPASRVLVSAHRGGAGEETRHHTLDAVREAVALGVDAVELDVAADARGALVLAHDAAAADGGRPSLAAALAALAALSDPVVAHVDLKVGGDLAVRAAGECWDALGVDRVVITTGRDAVVSALVARALARGRPDAVVGLSVGGWPSGSPWRRLRRLCRDAFPARRVRACGATALVAQHRLARAGLARWARRAGLPLLVWTVDTRRGLDHWLTPGRAWMVTTNAPALALARRERRGPQRTSLQDTG